MSPESVPDPARILKEIESIIPKDSISTDIFERIRNSIDIFPFDAEKDKLPYVVLFPKSSEHVSQILRFANSEKVPVFIRGSGTSLSGASRYHRSGIVINTRHLDKLSIFDECGYFECEPGCRISFVAEEIGKFGYFLPIYPGSRVIASMGGAIANNSSGHIINGSLGKPGDYVLGLEVILPNGDIIETGTKGLRKPAGTDLTKLFVGSDGILGFISKIRMRLIPDLPQAYGIAVFESLISMAKGVQRMYWEKRPIPIYSEFMHETPARIGFEIKEMPPPKGSVILFVISGNSKQEASHKMKAILGSYLSENPIEAYEVEDIKFWHKVWSTREALGVYLIQYTKNKTLSSEIVSNLRDFPECMEDAMNFNKNLPTLKELPLYLYGHIGDLTLHPVFLLPREWDEEKKKRAFSEKFQKEAELNLKYGTCGGEWGQFSKRTPFFIQRYGQKSYEIVKSLKKVFDPNNIFNPGILEGYR